MTVKDRTTAIRRDLVQLVAIAGKGRGVIARKPIPKGTLLESAPVIRMQEPDTLTVDTVLSQYPFVWDEPPYVQAFALGWVGLFNHADTPNCRVETDTGDQVIRIWTTVDVKRGVELTHNYGVTPWFEVAD